MNYFFAPIPTTALMALSFLANVPAAHAATKADELHQHSGLSTERSSHSLPYLTLSPCISRVAREHSYAQQQSANLYHNNDRNSQIKSTCGISHWGWYSDESSENVGRGGGSLANSAYVLQGFLSSPGHHANIDGSYTHVGIGSYKGSDGWLFITQIFINCQANCSLLEQDDPQPPLADWSAAPSPSATPPVSNLRSSPPSPLPPPPPPSPSPPPPVPEPPPPQIVPESPPRPHTPAATNPRQTTSPTTKLVLIISTTSLLAPAFVRARRLLELYPPHQNKKPLR